MLLKDDEKRRIASDVRAAFPAITFPEQLSQWLKNKMGGVLAETARDCDDPPTAAEVAAMAVAAVYGPRAIGLPSDELLHLLIAASGLNTSVDQRSIERALVFGLQLDPTGESWNHRWPGAWDTLFHMVKRTITPSVRWIGNRVLGMDVSDLLRDQPKPELDRKKREFDRWVRQEAGACATQIRAALIYGCNCWRRWEDFRIQDQALAMHHCETQHVFDNWDWATTSLEDYLFQAAIKGALRVPDHVNGIAELANTNDFRRGMLAKAVTDEELMAGPVLRCAEETCRGEILLADHCDNPDCGTLASVKEPSWWLWVKAHRRPTFCRRCNACGCLYFQWRGDCPGCGGRNWSLRLTEVWIKVQQVLGLEPDQMDLTAGEPDPSELAKANERLVAILKRIDGWDDDPVKIIARRLYNDGWDIEDIAQELKLKATSTAFKKLVREMCDRLSDLMDEQGANS